MCHHQQVCEACRHHRIATDPAQSNLHHTVTAPAQGTCTAAHRTATGHIQWKAPALPRRAVAHSSRECTRSIKCSSNFGFATGQAPRSLRRGPVCFFHSPRTQLLWAHCRLASNLCASRHGRWQKRSAWNQSSNLLPMKLHPRTSMSGRTTQNPSLLVAAGCSAWLSQQVS